MWRLRQIVDKAQDFIAPETPQESRPEYGFRVLFVDPTSQSFESGLEPLFDYIVSVDGQPLLCEFNGPEPVAPMDSFYSKLGNARELGVWSAKGGTIRPITISPQPTSESFGLGISLRWTATESADHVWHILDINSGSPAANAGLLAHSDYIVGAHNGVLEGGGEHMLGRAVANAAHENHSLILFVYNHDYDSIRPVEIHPKVDPYGNASMGCSIGYGLLHRLPVKATDNLAPGSTLYEGEFDHANAAPPIPAAVPASAPTAPMPAPAPRKKHAKKEGGNPALGDYFSEQQEISRQRDGSRKAKGDAAPPPPKRAQAEASNE